MKLWGAQQIVCQGIGLVPDKMTFSALHEIPTRSFALRFEVANFSSNENVKYHAAYAVSSSINDWVTPTNSDGKPDNLLWRHITVNGSTDIEIACSNDLSLPRRVLTDLMSFDDKPLTRIDGGQGICIFYRQFAVSGRNTVRNFDSTVGLWKDFPNGQHPGQFSQTFGGGWMAAGDFCSTNFEVPSGGAVCIAASAPHALLPSISNPTITLLSVGDSMLSGVASRGLVDRGINNVGLQVVKRLNTNARSALHVNQARSGMNSSNFIKDAYSSLRNYEPDIILMQASSPNDAPFVSENDMWKGFQRSMEFASAANRQGACVIVLTQPPYAGRGSPRDKQDIENIRKFANKLIKESCLLYVDSDEILGDGECPVTYKAGMSDDHDMVHPNETGSSALAGAVLRILNENLRIDYNRSEITISQSISPSDKSATDCIKSETLGDILIFKSEVPSNLSRKILYTFHGSYLYIDESDYKIKHKQSATDNTINLFAIEFENVVHLEFIRNDGTIFGCFPRAHDPRIFVDKNNTSEAVFRAYPISGDHEQLPVSLAYHCVYFSADPNGETSLLSLKPGAWERFNIVDLDNQNE